MTNIVSGNNNLLTTVILTGSTGFLGSALVRGLLNENYQIIGIKRSTSDTWRIKQQITDPRLQLFDIDKNDPTDIFKKYNINAIIHTATEYGRDNAPVYKILEANLILPLRLAELGIRNGTQLFINTDSYFNKNNNSYQHLLNYSSSKKSLLIWLNQISKNLKIINVILEHIYGPYDSHSKFVEGLIQKIAIQKVPHVSLTHGHQKRDFIHLNDVIDSYIKILEFGLTRDFRFKSFEIGTGKSTTVRDLALKIKAISNSPTILGFGDIPYRSDEIMESIADITELASLEWFPKFDLRDGLIQNIKTYEMRKDNK
jgi:nucleoside-diphosphate-sugar epimerase